jgi:drug/metabolite transporter (DMT)-like permease
MQSGTARSAIDQAVLDASAAATLAALVRTKRLGIALMVMSAGLLTVGDATAKWLSTTYPIGEIIFIRGLLIVMLLAAMRLPYGLAGLMPHHLMGQFRRALFFVLATFLMIWSLSLLPLATASAISFAAPIITTALAPWMLGETVGWRRWTAVLVGFLGVLLIVAPFGGDWTWALLIPVGAAAAQSLRDIVTRQLVGTETNESVVFVTMGASVLAGAMSAPFSWINPSVWAWVMPSAWDFALFTFYSVATCAAYLMQVGALRAAEAAFLAPFKYSLMLWAILIGFAVWGHVPSVAVLAGSAIIICSGIFIWYREIGMRGRHV